MEQTYTGATQRLDVLAISGELDAAMPGELDAAMPANLSRDEYLRVRTRAWFILAETFASRELWHVAICTAACAAGALLTLAAWYLTAPLAYVDAVAAVVVALLGWALWHRGER